MTQTQYLWLCCGKGCANPRPTRWLRAGGLAALYTTILGELWGKWLWVWSTLEALTSPTMLWKGSCGLTGPAETSFLLLLRMLISSHLHRFHPHSKRRLHEVEGHWGCSQNSACHRVTGGKTVRRYCDVWRRLKLPESLLYDSSPCQVQRGSQSNANKSNYH